MTDQTFTINDTVGSFGGKLLKLSHNSKSNGCVMNVNVYFPPQAESGPVPVLFFLAGLTSTQDNCAEKGFLQPSAAKHGIAVVYPDTSPRGRNIPGEDTDWDLGTGAGFYVDATQEPWKGAYNMYTYVTEELPQTLASQFSKLDLSRAGITGFSMGGHGALTLYLKNPEKYKSISAFSPIANPVNGPWGKKAMSAYFGKDNIDQWKRHDATELIKQWPKDKPLNILIDVGADDRYIGEGELLIDNFTKAAEESGNSDKITVRTQPGYNHSYYFVATYIEDHFVHAAKYLFE